MFRNGNILSFFKPHQPAPKRPAGDAQLDDNQTQRRTRSRSPFEVRNDTKRAVSCSQEQLPVSTVPATDIPPSAAETSSLTSLSDHEPVSSPVDITTAEVKQTHVPQPVNISFTSSGNISTPSQRMTRNGQDVVIDSDDDSDASLEDLDTILARFKPTKPKAPEVPASKPQNASYNTPVTRNGKYNKNTTPRTIPIKYKFSLDNLVAASKKESEQRKEIEEFIREAGISDTKSNILGKTVPTPSINTDLLASMIKDENEDDNVERVMKAVERTEALHGKLQWQLFTRRCKDISLPDFPKSLPKPFQSILGNLLDRDAAIVGGFLADIAGKRPLPDELATYLLESAVFDRRSDFHHAYLETLKKSPKVIARLVTPGHVVRWLTTIGADEQKLKDDYVVQPEVLNKEQGSIRSQDWTLLRNVLRLISQLAPAMKPEVRKAGLQALFKAALDAHVAADASTVMLLKEALEALLDTCAEGDLPEWLPRAMEHVYEQVNDPQLRCQFLHMLASLSPLVCCMRKRLASAFFFEDPDVLKDWPGIPSDLSDFEHHLYHDSKYGTDDIEDFAELGARIAMLDMAIDDGEAPKGADTKIEKEYNAMLDRLSEAIGQIQSGILDAGANHMARTEAKEALEGLQRRLDFSVRTRRKKKENDVFGKSDSTNEKVTKFFLPRTKVLEE